MHPEAAEFDIAVLRQRYCTGGAQTANATAILLGITTDPAGTPGCPNGRLVVVVAGRDGSAKPHVRLFANPDEARTLWRRYRTANPDSTFCRRTMTCAIGPAAALRESRSALGPWWPLLQQRLGQALLPYRHAGRDARVRRWRTQATNRFLAEL